MPHDLSIVLVTPEIPNNTGSIGRLCLATNSKLHLVNGIDFTHKNTTNDALFDMIKFVLQDNVDYIYNREVSLFGCNIVEKIKKNISEGICE